MPEDRQVAQQRVLALQQVADGDGGQGGHPRRGRTGGALHRASSGGTDS
jgi:hypothetical protein